MRGGSGLKNTNLNGKINQLLSHEDTKGVHFKKRKKKVNAEIMKEKGT